jgi:hypothetical protein
MLQVGKDALSICPTQFAEAADETRLAPSTFRLSRVGPTSRRVQWISYSDRYPMSERAITARPPGSAWLEV